MPPAIFQTAIENMDILHFFYPKSNFQANFCYLNTFFRRKKCCSDTFFSSLTQLANFCFLIFFHQEIRKILNFTALNQCFYCVFNF